MSCPMTYWSRNSLSRLGDGMEPKLGRPAWTRRRSCLKMFWHSSVQLAQMYTSLGPSTMGPTSRELFPQNEQVVIRRPLNPVSPPSAAFLSRPPFFWFDIVPLDFTV